MTASKTSAQVGDRILLTFSAPLVPEEGDQYWTSLAQAGTPDDDWGTWHYLPSGAIKDEIVAGEPGAYEIRLHDAYPSRAGVLARVPILVASKAPDPQPTATAAPTQTGEPTEGDGEERFVISGGRETFHPGEKIKIVYPRPLVAPSGQQYWITLARAGSEDSDWGKWHYVKRGAKTDELEAKESGDFEVRLHDLYPATRDAVLQRRSVHVE